MSVQLYPRQPNRKVNLNIKSSNIKIIWFSVCNDLHNEKRSGYENALMLEKPN